MKKPDKDDLITIFYIFLCLLPIILVIGYLILYTYCIVKYGSVPISELPAWVYFILKGNGGGGGR